MGHMVWQGKMAWTSPSKVRNDMLTAYHTLYFTLWILKIHYLYITPILHHHIIIS